MSPWLIAGLCAAGAALISWGAARLRLLWPCLVLSLLLAAIAGQLLWAARGQGGYRDLAAILAQGFTVLPALAGLALGLAVAALSGHPPAWRSRAGLASGLCLAAASGMVAVTLLL